MNMTVHIISLIGVWVGGFMVGFGLAMKIKK